jgi:hypothetical protein
LKEDDETNHLGQPTSRQSSQPWIETYTLISDAVHPEYLIFLHRLARYCSIVQDSSQFYRWNFFAKALKDARVRC